MTAKLKALSVSYVWLLGYLVG